MTQSWHLGRVVGFDLETTSRDPREARIVQAALVCFDPAADGARWPRRPTSVREWLVDPGVEIPLETTRIHGISTADARAHGRPAAAAVAELIAALRSELVAGSTVVVMNAPYDCTVLRHEADRYGLALPEFARVVDPLVVDRYVDAYRRGKRTLGDLCGIYEVVLNGAHSAVADAEAAVGVAMCLAERYPEVRMPAEQLHELQVTWKAEQAASFEEYLRGQGRTAEIDPSWPLALPATPVPS